VPVDFIEFFPHLIESFRPPSPKPGNFGNVQANFEQRFQPSGQWQSNGHLDILREAEELLRAAFINENAFTIIKIDESVAKNVLYRSSQNVIDGLIASPISSTSFGSFLLPFRHGVKGMEACSLADY
jgi:hypothetical protein